MKVAGGNTHKNNQTIVKCSVTKEIIENDK